MSMHKAWIDAEAGNNAKICIVLESNSTIPIKKKIGKATEVQAKYTALIQALNMLLSYRVKEAQIYTDSEYIIRHLKSGKNINGTPVSHKGFLDKIYELIGKFKLVNLEYLPKSKLRLMTGM